MNDGTGIIVFVAVIALGIYAEWKARVERRDAVRRNHRRRR